MFDPVAVAEMEAAQAAAVADAWTVGAGPADPAAKDVFRILKSWEEEELPEDSGEDAEDAPGESVDRYAEEYPYGYLDGDGDGIPDAGIPQETQSGLLPY